MEFKQLLNKRRLLKKKKPEFMKQDAHKKIKLSSSWRKPRGSDSKMRVRRRGYRRTVKIGWGSPAAVKGLDKKGLLPVIVNNVKDLAKADPKKNSIIIGSGVGAKNKILIIEQALAKKISILNFKDPAKFVKDTEEAQEKRKKDKTQLKDSREKKKEAAKKEAEKKKAKEEKEKADGKEAELTDDEKKKEEKKEKDKLLISKQ